MYFVYQADWLLHNIIPKHVSDQLKKSAKYSENHKDVGIVFASLVNFNELYDESYMGGKVGKNWMILTGIFCSFLNFSMNLCENVCYFGARFANFPLQFLFRSICGYSTSLSATLTSCWTSQSSGKWQSRPIN